MGNDSENRGENREIGSGPRGPTRAAGGGFERRLGSFSLLRCMSRRKSKSSPFASQCLALTHPRHERNRAVTRTTNQVSHGRHSMHSNILSCWPVIAGFILWIHNISHHNNLHLICGRTLPRDDVQTVDASSDDPFPR